MLFFWKGRERPVESDEGLSALLTRRDEVRAKTTSTITQPAPELFQPTRSVPVNEPGTPLPIFEPQAPVETGSPKAGEEKSVSTTNRLLEAKRRAQRRTDSDKGQD